MKKGYYIPKEIYEDEKYSTLIPICGNFDLIKLLIIYILKLY